MTNERTPASPSYAQVIEGAARAGTLTGIPPSIDLDRATASLLGTGESYAVWSLSDGTHGCALRIPARPLDEMPHPMGREFQAASHIPASVGPRALAYEERTDNPLGVPYIVTELAPGVAKRQGSWTQQDFDRLVPVIADLHTKYQDEGSNAQHATTKYDLLGGFREARQWWEEAEPELSRSGSIATLGDAVERFIQERDWACQGVRTCFVHGDLCATNIVFGDEGEPRLIDWEWSQVGDPAKDLAYVGGEAYCDPWYMPMTREQVKRFVRQYAALTPAASAEELEDEYQRLLARRDAWEAWERFTMGLHCMRRGRDDDSAFYREAGEAMHHRLRDLLQREQTRKATSPA